MQANGMTSAETAGKQMTKRVVAWALVVFFAFFCVGEAVALRSIPPIAWGNVWGSLAGLIAVVLLPVAGLIVSLRWSLRLAGYKKSAGKQTWAVFLAGFCGLGFVFVAAAALGGRSSGTLTAGSVIVGLLYVAGCYAALRWFWRLRRREREKEIAA